jgi:hypothetical protein
MAGRESGKLSIQGTILPAFCSGQSQEACQSPTEQILPKRLIARTYGARRSVKMTDRSIHGMYWLPFRQSWIW